MNIAILDSVYLENYHMNSLKRFGDVLVYDDVAFSDEELMDRIKTAEIVITASTNIRSQILHSCPSLKLIALAATGSNRIDLDAANKLGIMVTNVPSYSTDAVAEHVFALVLTLLKKARESDAYVRKGGYDWRLFRLAQLAGKTFGVIGYGQIGSRVADIASCFGCNVIANTVPPPSEEIENVHRVKFLSFNDILAKSDIISLHVPLNETTENLISHDEFNQMKRKPILINTARGKLIDHDALVDALVAEKISGVGLDVLPEEPPVKDDLLLKFPNAVFSPHAAFNTIESSRKCADIVVDNIESFISDKPKNVVNKDIFKNIHSGV